MSAQPPSPEAHLLAGFALATAHVPMTLTLAFSPCPNDTFIFDAMVHGRVDTEGLAFTPVLADVEVLNQTALESAATAVAKTSRDVVPLRYDITKLSYLTVAQVQQHYQVLDSGSALGDGVGPLLIADEILPTGQLDQLPVAVPGLNTTASFLLKFAFPTLQHLVPMLFSDIEAAIRAGDVAAGAIIHESRFTYAERGFQLVQDLGEHWTDTTGTPIPLGGICVSRQLDRATLAKVQRVLRRSVDYAFVNPAASRAYVQQHAQELDAEVQRQHIATYVNDYSRSLGERGRQAVQTLLREAHQRGLSPALVEDLFLPTTA